MKVEKYNDKIFGVHSILMTYDPKCPKYVYKEQSNMKSCLWDCLKCKNSFMRVGGGWCEAIAITGL